MYEAKADVAKNTLHITLKGRLRLDEAIASSANVLAEAKRLRTGFTVVNDISEAKPSDDDVTTIIKQTQVALAGMGVTRIIRVVSPASAAATLQFSRLHRESHAGYSVETVTSMEEALKRI